MTIVNFLIAAAWIAGGYVPPAENEYRAFFEDAPAPVLRKTFELGAVPSNGTWTIAAAGMVDATLNGERMTPTALPGWTDYDVRVLSHDYDVTRFLKKGVNTLELHVGNGWYNLLPMKMWGRYNLRENLAQGTPCVRAALRVTFADGAEREIATDATWRAADGPVLRNSLYLGERFDARREPADWKPARVVEGPKGRIEPARDMPKVVVYRRWKAKTVTEPKPGVFVVDCGENFAGNLRMTLRNVRSGQEVAIRYGELLNADGTVNVMTTVAGQQKNAAIDPPGLACQTDTLVCRDAAACVYEPRFTFHTFRYAEISGLGAKPAPDDFEALAYSADVADAGGFTCSDPRLVAVREMCRRTFRANLQGVQSDCPARERFGYGGDLAATAESFILNYDMHGFYRKVLRDRCDSAARADGVFSSVSPAAFPRQPDFRKVSMGWAVDVPIVVDLLVRYYGDLDAVKETYPSLKRFLDGCAAAFRPEDTPRCIGDHEALDKADRQTTAMCHYHQFLKLTAKFARRLGETSDAARYEATAGELERIFAERARYVPARGFVGNGRQGEEAFALYHRMLPSADLDAAYGILKYDVVAHGNALSTGIFATQYLLEILTERGDADLAGKVALHEGFPGWLNMLDRGATTLWESWIGSDDIYSHCHPMFGSVAGWMMKGVLGIRVAEDAVGCDRVEIAPHACAGLTSASGWYETPRGRITVSWRLVGGRLKVETKVPDGVTVLKGGAEIPETQKWQARIDAAAARGGGRVSVPAGRHLVGQLDLRSNVELHLEKGCVLEGQYGLDNYRVLELPFSEGTWSAVVSGVNVTNVAITGEGTIDGQGAKWPAPPKDYKGYWEGLRPRGVFFAYSKNIRLEDYTLRNSACWGNVFKNCDGVVARRVKVFNHGNLNNDGFDIEARNVLIEDCEVSSSDDCYCIKSNDPGFTVENVTIRRCTARGQANSFKIGTATRGIVRNIRFLDNRCDMPRGIFARYADGTKVDFKFHYTVYDHPEQYPYGFALTGVAVECVDGGCVEDVVVDGLALVDGVKIPIFVRADRRKAHVVSAPLPRGNRNRLANVTIRNVSGYAMGPTASSITGVEGFRVDGVTLENIDIRLPGAGETASARALKDPRPYRENRYPSPDIFYPGIMPAYGLYVDHADRVTRKNVRFRLLEGGPVDLRPETVFADCR